MRTKKPWTWNSAVPLLAVAALLAGIPRAHAEGPEAGEPQGLTSLRAAVRMLVKTQAGPIPGTPRSRALPMLLTWAPSDPQWTTSLERTPYALGADVKGLVRVVVAEAGVTSLTIDLALQGVARARLREVVTEVGRELGYTMTTGKLDPWTCSGVATGQRGLSIGVGTDVVSIAVQVATEVAEAPKPEPPPFRATDAAIGLWGGMLAKDIAGGVFDSFVLGVDLLKDGTGYAASTRADVTVKSEQGEQKVVVTTKFRGKAVGDGILFESTDRRRTVVDGATTILAKAYLRVTPVEGHVVVRIGNDAEGYTAFKLVAKRE